MNIPPWFRRFIPIALVIILLPGCTGYRVAPVYTTGGEALRPSTSQGQTHVVQAGDSLSGIARRYQQTVATLAAWNRIGPPYLLRIGQVLWVSQPTATPPAPTPVSRPVAAPRPPANPAEPMKQVNRAVLGGGGRAAAVPQAIPASCQPGGTWLWPVQGRAERNISSTGRQGLNFFGQLGQPIYASASGQVSYSGPGLNGYFGNLIIIKHNAVYHSVYAHNKYSRVKEGEHVSAGQHIADMGTDNNNRPLLHFEIRCQEKTVNPLNYLSR